MKIIGDTPKVKRLITGLHSFDQSFRNAKGEIGFPLGQITELAGPTFCGKSTVAYGLCGRIAKENKTNIALVDFEGFDPDYLTEIVSVTGFDGDVNLIQKDGDEKTLDALITILEKKDYGVGMLDSVGAISPISELDGDLGDANMGRRAKLMAQFSRKIMHLLLSEPKTMFLINHLHPNLGGAWGMSTPGGLTMNYLSAIRIRLKRKEEFKDQSYMLEGKVTKNRFGYKDLTFHLMMLSGHGIHNGLTAMFDCFLSGLAERGATVKINGTGCGKLKEFFTNAHAGNNTVFDPFFELLKGVEIVEPADTGDEQAENPDTELED